MADVNVTSEILKSQLLELKQAAEQVSSARQYIVQQYQQVSVQWNDSKNRELGAIVNESNSALRSIEKTFLQGQKKLLLLLREVMEYESTNISSSAAVVDEGGYSRHFSSEEANAQYQRAIESIDEMIQTYRTELVAHGAMDGAMLTKFLAKQRADMLQYETEEINVARGLREPLSDEERYHYVIVGENSPYTYDNLMDEFGQFCMTDIQSWVSDINPNPNNDPRRHVNCGKCAAAVYERLNGSENAVAGLGTYSISEMNSITGRIQTSMSPADIESYLRTQGAGSHVVVGVDRANGAGHWFNAFFDGHQVYTIEGQGGEINGWPPDYGNVVHWDARV